jgi:hypothetical protein
MAKNVLEWDDEISKITKPLQTMINSMKAGRIPVHGILAEANIELKDRELAEVAAITRFLYDDVTEQLERLHKQVDIIYRSFVLGKAMEGEHECP